VSERNPLPYCLAHLAQINPVAAWQPIESAPKDGSVIPCCWAGRLSGSIYQPSWAPMRWKLNPRTNREYFGDPEEYDDYDLADDQPTHWFKMPESPS
jgi:hypothetical protein